MAALLWALCYLLPAFSATVLNTRLSSLRSRMIVMHAGIIISILFLTISGMRLNWQVSTLSAAVLLMGAAFSIALLRLEGAVYALSSSLQQICILLAALLLSEEVGTLLAAIATAIVYTFAHRMSRKDFYYKFVLLFLWGIIAVYLYIYLHQPLINIGIHCALGSLLLKSSILEDNY